jgi:hypothetical protein
MGHVCLHIHTAPKKMLAQEPPGLASGTPILAGENS